MYWSLHEHVEELSHHKAHDDRDENSPHGAVRQESRPDDDGFVHEVEAE